MRIRGIPGIGVLLGALIMAAPALAGPPLLCHPFDIGQARSLPWNGGASWSDGQAGYDITHVVADTEALLTPATPVIVRMETLRRAVLYAGRNPEVARALLQKMNDRARSAGSGSDAATLAYFDAAYVTEALREVTFLEKMPEFQATAAAFKDVLKPGAGYALIRKSLAQRPDDPTLHFAAALMSSDGNRSAYAAHAAKAREGAPASPLLAKNIQHVS
jgi:hypothetical protein